MKKVLVTGGAGSIGSYVCEYLIKRGHKVTALDNGTSRKVEHLFETGRFKFVQESILVKDAVDRLVDQNDIVIHLAAIADPKRYVNEPLNVFEREPERFAHHSGPLRSPGQKVRFRLHQRGVGPKPQHPLERRGRPRAGPAFN